MAVAKLPKVLQVPAVKPKMGHTRTVSIVTDLADLPVTDLKTADTGNPEDKFTLPSTLERLLDCADITNLFTSASHTGSTPVINPIVEYWGVDSAGVLVPIKSVTYDLAAGTTFSPDGGTTEMLPLDTASQQIDCSAFRYVLPFVRTAGDTATLISLILKAN